KFAAGAISAASAPLICLLSGTKTSAGSAVPNQDVVDIRSESDVAALIGDGSELARMCYVALKVPGATVKAAPSAEAGGARAAAGGAASATATITIAGSWTTTGSWSYRIDGVAVTGGILGSDTPTTVAAAIVAAVNAIVKMPVTAGNVAGVVTLTRKSKGSRG